MKKIRLYTYLTVIVLGGFFSIIFPDNTNANGNSNYDLLNQAFGEARDNDYVVGKGNTPQTIGGEIFNTTWNVNLDKDPETKIWEKEEPYIIRITKLIIRVGVALSVSIVIVGGIMYIVAFGDEGKQKKARTMITYALVGLLISLGALAIVQLATTITKNSLGVIS